jgi:hypothetical protein
MKRKYVDLRNVSVALRFSLLLVSVIILNCDMSPLEFSNIHNNLLASLSFVWVCASMNVDWNGCFLVCWRVCHGMRESLSKVRFSFLSTSIYRRRFIDLIEILFSSCL